MIDLNGTTRREDGIVALIDQALIERRSNEPKRNYLGASLMGKECLRALQFSYFNVSVDTGKELDGRKIRIFDRGHIMENYVITLLKQAGFNLRTIGRDGKQFEFSLLDGAIKGHSDGVCIGGPAIVNYPFLVEIKCLGAKYYKMMKNDGLKKYPYPTYYGQTQVMMAYFELTDNPALFVTLNADTMAIHLELVPFDAATAQRVSDNGVKVIVACRTGELLERLSSDPSFYKCKQCDWHDRCFSL